MSKQTKTEVSQSSGTKKTPTKASSTTGRKKTSPTLSKNTSKRRRKKKEEVRVTKTRKKALFPHGDTFPFFMEDITDNKKCWFQRIEHVESYLQRYKHEYKLYNLY